MVLSSQVWVENPNVRCDQSWAARLDKKAKNTSLLGVCVCVCVVQEEEEKKVEENVRVYKVSFRNGREGGRIVFEETFT